MTVAFDPGISVMSDPWLADGLEATLAASLIERLERFTETKTYRDLSELAGLLRLRRRVGLLFGPDQVMPMTWGLLRPVIFLPESAESWPEGQRRAVLLHELAHICRWDCATQAMARLACAIYWFHPLAWIAAARMRTERERACNDQVLLDGARPSEYAGELLSLAQSCRSVREISPCATAMARSSGLEARVRVILDPTVRRGVLSKRVLLIGLIVLAAVTVPVAAVRLYARQGPGEDEPRTGEVIVIPGRVVAREGDRPVAQAEIVTQIGTVQETTRTDASGRFNVRIPPDRRSGALAPFSITVRHPDFISKTGRIMNVADLIVRRSRGEPAFFEMIRLDPGVEYTGQVVRPDGAPAAALDLWFQNWGWNSYPREEHLTALDKVRTDAQGRFRMRMWKTKAIEINAMPDDFAPLQQFIGYDGPSNERPDYNVPADLGHFVLEDGIRAAGRMVDRNGRPMAGQRVEIQGRIRIFARRTAFTGADGSFAFGPLRPGSYTVQAEGQGRGGGIDWSLPPLPPPVSAIWPVKVVLEAAGHGGPIELKEAATVTVTCRFVDSQGRRVNGAPVSLTGLIPDANGKADPFEVAGAGMINASAVNQPEPKDASTRIDWGVQAVPDSEGKVVFHAPKGLRIARLDTFPLDDGKSIKTRLREGAELKFWGGGRLGDLVEDVPGVTFVYYRAPTVIATVEAEEGELPENLQVGESFIGPNGGSFGGSFERQADGRYRSRSLMPDHVYDITAGAPGWLWTKVGEVSLPEGGYKEVSLFLRKKPEALRVGDLAPDPGSTGSTASRCGWPTMWASLSCSTCGKPGADPTTPISRP